MLFFSLVLQSSHLQSCIENISVFKQFFHPFFLLATSSKSKLQFVDFYSQFKVQQPKQNSNLKVLFLISFFFSLYNRGNLEKNNVKLSNIR